MGRVNKLPAQSRRMVPDDVNSGESLIEQFRRSRTEFASVALPDAIERLPVYQQKIVQMCCVDHLEINDVAEQLGLPREKAELFLARGIRQLAKAAR